MLENVCVVAFSETEQDSANVESPPVSFVRYLPLLVMCGIDS